MSRYKKKESILQSNLIDSPDMFYYIFWYKVYIIGVFYE